MQTDELIAAVDAEWVAERTRELVEGFSVTLAEAEGGTFSSSTSRWDPPRA